MPKPRAAAPAAASGAGAKPRKLGYKEQRELDALPERIEALEREQKDLAALLASAELYAEDPVRAEAAQMRYAQIDDELLARARALGGARVTVVRGAQRRPGSRTAAPLHCPCTALVTQPLPTCR